MTVIQLFLVVVFFSLHVMFLFSWRKLSIIGYDGFRKSKYSEMLAFSGSLSICFDLLLILFVLFEYGDYVVFEF